MARRSGIGSVLLAIARESARQERLAHQEAIRNSREALRRAREQQRYQAAMLRQAETERRQSYLEQRLSECEEANRIDIEKIDSLANILSHTLKIDDTINFESLKITDDPPALFLPDHFRNPPAKPAIEHFTGLVLVPGRFAALFPWIKRRYMDELSAAKLKFSTASHIWEQNLRKFEQERSEIIQSHENKVRAFNEKKIVRNDEVDAFRHDYFSKDPSAIVSYFSMVLERSEYPEGFPQNFSVAYKSDSNLLVVEYELPSVDVIPKEHNFKYSRQSDEFVGKLRKSSEIKSIYSDIVSSICLRTIHEIFESDSARAVDIVCFNGYVKTVDPATGKDIQPHLVSVRTSRSIFMEIDLLRIDKAACLRNLGAQVSRSASEATPVRPIVEFDMVDPRFVDQSDIVSGLSSATNLMDLNPFEFEQLVSNLFEKMGLPSKLTRSTKDGGIDCIAFDPRPVLGGKVVIQAKRYRNTVGVSTVRDLYGTMVNEGANKGLLVTTSGYGPDAYDFCRDKPIELIDGGGLLYLLQEVGVQARIIMPEEP